MKKKNKISVSETLLKIINVQPKSAEELAKEIKDEFGYSSASISLAEIRVNLLYLRRREKTKRKKDGSTFKYFI